MVEALRALVDTPTIRRDTQKACLVTAKLDVVVLKESVALLRSHVKNKVDVYLKSSVLGKRSSPPK